MIIVSWQQGCLVLGGIQDEHADKVGVHLYGLVLTENFYLMNRLLSKKFCIFMENICQYLASYLPVFTEFIVNKTPYSPHQFIFGCFVPKYVHSMLYWCLFYVDAP